jgi:hypothetical protein
MKKITFFFVLMNTYLGFSQCVISLNLNIHNASDSAVCDGYVSVLTSGNTGSVDYMWNCNTCSNFYSSTATGLCAGTSGTVTVSDSAGCTGTASWSIGMDPCVNFGAMLSSTPSSGPNICDGSILQTPFGGTPPYVYSIGNGTVTFNTNNPTNLCPGTYNVSTYDANGCNLTTITTVGIDSCNGLSISFSNLVNTSSPASCDGAVNASANGGTAPYSYVWSNGITSSNPNNLCSGNYTVCVTASNGCQVCDSIVISDSTSNACQGFYAISETTNVTDSASCDGSMTIIPFNGAGPFTFSFSNAGTTSSSTTYNLCAGTYVATVVDANGCVATVSGTVMPLNSSIGDTIILNGNITTDSSFIGADSSDWINNCSIYYDSIISGYISGFSALSNDSVIVDWVLNYLNGDSVIVTANYSLNAGSGTYLLTLLLYCPQKSGPKYLIVNSEFDFEASSLLESSFESLNLYPNPANEFISIDGLNVDSIYEIVDLSGKILCRGKYDARIDISTLSKGTYLVNVTNKNKKAVLRLIK